MNNLSITKRLMIVVGILVFSVLAGAIYNSFLVQNCSNRGEILYKNYGHTQGEIGILYADFKEVKIQIRNALYVYAEDPSKMETSAAKARAYMDSFTTNFQTVKDGLLDESTKQVCDLIQENISQYFESVETCLDITDSGDMEGAREYFAVAGVAAADNAEAYIKDLQNSLRELADVYSLSIVAENKQSTTGALVSSLVLIAISLTLSVYTIRSIQIPLNRMTEAAKKISEGNVDVTIQREGNNEIGDLQESFSIMINNIRQQSELVSQIADGNLQVNAYPRSDYDIMNKAIKRLIDDNNRILTNIKSAAFQIASGSDQVASASQSLAQASTEQASAVEEISSSITEIASNTKQNASRAASAKHLVDQAKEHALLGNKEMHEMITAMNDINESSENISKIIKVIDDISFQTNILALNAAVEAARAGKHGKGFAVVAEEVRNLAEKSSIAASETATMIEDSIKKANRGTALAANTASSLDEIVHNIEQIVELISTISIASNEQATATAQIDQALGQVASVTQNNSATSQQCAAASDELSGQADSLRALIMNFKLK